MTRSFRAMVRLLAPAVAIVTSGCGSATTTPALRIGAVFPLTGSQSSLGQEEFDGVTMAVTLANADGGAGGRRIELVTHDYTSARQADQVADALAHDGVTTVIGAYSSDLSMPVSAAVSRRGMVYWEAGAVADQVTGRGLPMVFRVGATGTDLGANSARFAAEQLAPRLGLAARQLTVALVTADDLYGHSVADAARAKASALGAHVVSETVYNEYQLDFQPSLTAVAVNHPDVLILSSHIPDGIAFRRAFLAAGLHVGAFIGSTMAQCLPDFGDALGTDAVGVFASDRPGDGFTGRGLGPEGRADYDRFAAAWKARHGGTPDEEALAGFSAGWALVHHLLPRVGAMPTAAAIQHAAQGLDIVEGTLPDGAGVHFATAGSQLGQNDRAAAVIWQWQAARKSVVVWPAAFAGGTVGFVPLPR